MSKSLRFKLFSPLRQPAVTAARYALSQLSCGGQGVESSDDVEILHNVAAIQTLWRARVRLLQSLGWPRVGGDLNCSYALNCPPFGVASNQSDLSPCNITQICPFCWSRYYSAAAYNRCRLLLSNAADRHYELQEIYTQFQVDRQHRSLAAVFSWIRTTKAASYYRRLSHAVGAYVLCSVVPHEVGWLLSHKLLAVVQPGSLPPAMSDKEIVGFKPQRSVQRRVIGDDFSSLAAIIGRATSYPAELLTCPPAAALEIIVARDASRVAMSGTYGALRGLKSRDVDEPAEIVADATRLHCQVSRQPV